MTRSAASVAIIAALACSAHAQERGPSSAAPAATKSETSAPLAPLCFSVTLHCFGSKPASLDLRAPPIANVVPKTELLTVLPDPDEPKYDEPLVKVEGERGVPVNVPVGIMSLPWAVRHPTQFWRIFLPSPSRVSEDD